MNGIIILNKEKGFTSFDCVKKIKHLLNEKKVGHTGTLDPDATGVLVVCVGEACKAVQFLEADKKVYQVRIVIGLLTDTGDLTGNILEDKKIDYFDIEKIDQVLDSFIGKQKQVPPIYSAIKVKGKKLYQYARNNEQVEIESRDIEIYSIKRTSDIELINDKIEFSFDVEVSKGTYIRSLCVDIADRLGLPGTMKNLNRIVSGSFSINQAVTLKDIENNDFQLYPILNSFKDYPKLVDEDSIYKAKHGMKISPILVRDLLGNNPLNIIICEGDELIAIYELDGSNKYYKAVRVWNY